MRLCFQHGIGFERVVTVEGSVETEDLLRLPRHHTAQYGLGDGVLQANQQLPLCYGKDRLTLGLDLLHLGRRRQPRFEYQFVQDVLPAARVVHVIGVMLQLQRQLLGFRAGLRRIPNLEVGGRQFEGAKASVGLGVACEVELPFVGLIEFGDDPVRG